MISLFSTGDFIRVTIKEDHYGLGRVGLLMGFIVTPTASGHHIAGVVSGQDGDIGTVAMDDILSDFIYDVDQDHFIDRSAKERDEVGIGDGEDLEE